MPKYNIVLTPSLENRQIFIDFAKKHFSDIHKGYLLGDNSIPHISLCQFDGNEEQLQQITEGLKGLHYSSFYSPQFQIFNMLSLGGSLKGKDAADLGVVKTTEIQDLHSLTTRMVQDAGLIPMNAVGESYRPHLTLACFSPEDRPTTPEHEALLLANIPFTVAVGIADDNWQFTKILANQIELSAASSSNILINHFGYTSKQVVEFLKSADSMKIGLDEFLKGKIFNSNYSEDEQRQICDELIYIVNEQFTNKTAVDDKMYITSAGAPGSGKTFFLENNYCSDPHNNAVYVDPDRSVLPKLKIYTQSLQETGSNAAYTKWRDASNYIANFMLVKAVYENLNVIHGTTASSDRIISVYNYLKQQGYKIKIDLFFANESDRVQSINYREQTSGRVQVTTEDMKGKVAPVFLRMNDCYFKYADQITMFYQFGCFWHAGGITKCFAEYKKELSFVQVLPSSEQYIEALIAEIDCELKGKLDSVVQLKEFVSGWRIVSECSVPMFFKYAKNENQIVVNDGEQQPVKHELQPGQKTPIARI